MPATKPAKGRVTKVMGPMFSGKTHEAIFLCLRRLAVGSKVAYVSHTADVRFGEKPGEVRGHGGHSLSAPIAPRTAAGGLKVEHDGLSVYRTSALATVPALFDADAHDFVVIDEAQWFEGLAAAVRRLSNAGKDVVVCGLDYTAECSPFGEVLALPADETRTLKALCGECRQPASFTLRTAAVAAGGAAQMDVGGTEKYAAVCRQHHPSL
jgi:thymidine kinase